jgi:hypothetical protein
MEEGRRERGRSSVSSTGPAPKARPSKRLLRVGLAGEAGGAGDATGRLRTHAPTHPFLFFFFLAFSFPCLAQTFC